MYVGMSLKREEMRLTDFQKTKIKEIVLSLFGSDTELYLFGSRVDDTKKGGDIDLLVKAPYSGIEAESITVKAITKIQFAIGDQKIDMVVTPDAEADSRLVVKEALRTGVRM